MKPGRPSTSAGAVALARALESSRSACDRLFEDPFARSLLGPAAPGLFHLVRLPVLGALLLGIADRLAPGVLGFTIGRTRYIDDATSKALREGVEQIVILGAGYDSRAYRINGIERTRVYEVDHPDTQALKRARLDPVLAKTPGHVRFVSIDFNRQALGTALLAAGFRESSRTFFIWEGVTEYLSAPVVDATFRYVAGATAGESTIVFTYMDCGVLSGTVPLGTASKVLVSSRFGREPFTFGLNPVTLGVYLSARGLELVEDVAGTEFKERYFKPLGRHLRANEFQRTALAKVRKPSVSPPVASMARRPTRRSN